MWYLSGSGLPDVGSSLGGMGMGGRPGTGDSAAGGVGKVDTDDIWSDKVPAVDPHDQGGQGGHGSRPTVQRPKPASEDEKWVVNEHGDMFRRQPLPPVHPDLSLLPAPSTLFPEVGDIGQFLRPPTYDPFPTSRLRDIISDLPDDEEVPDPDRYPRLPEDAYSQTWVRPDVWDEAPGAVRKVQWEGFSTGRSDTWETAEEKAVRVERKEAVRRGFVWAWQKYKDHAWGESLSVH